VRSNCHIQAWRAHRRGEAAALIFRPTEYSRLLPIVRHWAWSPLRLLGAAMQWLGHPLMQFGSTLRDGRWWHVQWQAHDGALMEWSMLKDGTVDTVSRHWAPPLSFNGTIRRADVYDAKLMLVIEKDGKKYAVTSHEVSNLTYPELVQYEQDIIGALQPMLMGYAQFKAKAVGE